jgi:hypothetical protein
VDVDRPPLVPTRVDRREAGLALRIGALRAASARRARGREAGICDIGVHTQVVAVPDVDLGTREGRTGGPCQSGDHEGELQGDPEADTPIGGVGSEVAPLEPLVDEVRALGLCGPHHTSRGAVGSLCPRWGRARQEADAASPQEGEDLTTGEDLAERAIVEGHRCLR